MSCKLKGQEQACRRVGTALLNSARWRFSLIDHDLTTSIMMDTILSLVIIFILHVSSTLRQKLIIMQLNGITIYYPHEAFFPLSRLGCQPFRPLLEVAQVVDLPNISTGSHPEMNAHLHMHVLCLNIRKSGFSLSSENGAHSVAPGRSCLFRNTSKSASCNCSFPSAIRSRSLVSTTKMISCAL